MKSKNIFLGILSGINLIIFAYTIFVLFVSFGFGLIMLIPLILALITFVVLRKIKKFDTLRALKYANLVYFIPAGILAGFFLSIASIQIQRTAGMPMIDPIHQQCIDMCKNKTQEIVNAAADCLNNCIKNLTNK